MRLVDPIPNNNNNNNAHDQPTAVVCQLCVCLCCSEHLAHKIKNQLQYHLVGTNNNHTTRTTHMGSFRGESNADVAK